jgi:hypothetical protein
MPTPLIAVETRFFNPEVTVVYWLPSCAVVSAPTRAEMNAGTNITKPIADLSGWMTASEMIDVPDMGSRFVGKIPGRISADNSSLTFYLDKLGVSDARTVMPRDATGFMLWLDGGDVAGRKMDNYPCTVASHGKIRSTGNDAARITIQYAITAVPSENITIPA